MASQKREETLLEGSGQANDVYIHMRDRDDVYLSLV